VVVHGADASWGDVLPRDLDGPWAVHPIRGTSGLVGIIAVPAGVHATDDDEMLLRRMAGTASVALANLRVFVEEHRTALTLQRSLLPSSLPPLPGLVVAARYKASGEQVEIGGDFFDAFTIDDRRSVVVIGDVEGHSLEAAVVMAELRYSLRAYMYDGHTATEVLALLNRLLQRGHPDLTATMCLLVFSEDRRTVEVANAGHLPPLLVRDGQASYLQPSGTLLGLDGHASRSLILPVEPGNRILLMTDGLVERRGKSMEAALRRVGEQAARSALSAEDLCDRLMETWGGGGEDDVCLMVLDVLTSPAARPPADHQR
jgi:serine phosphatase RsbU (regulator of sigma subunit)